MHPKELQEMQLQSSGPTAEAQLLDMPVTTMTRQLQATLAPNTLQMTED